MPTKREREYYAMGYQDGYKLGRLSGRDSEPNVGFYPDPRSTGRFDLLQDDVSQKRTTRPKRKLSAWNKFVKANSKKPRFIYKSGTNKGKLNLKKMGVAFRKTPAGKRKK